jgi:poly(A) polymerase
MPFKKFPQNTPLILYIISLFSNLSSKEAEILCKKLKISNKELKVVKLFYLANELLEKETEDHLWAHFFTHDDADMLLEVMSAFHKREKITNVIKKKIILQKAILRLKENNPVVKADHLEKHGIKPGKSMGLLLKEAIKISINDFLEHPTPIIAKLKKTHLWPK